MRRPKLNGFTKCYSNSFATNASHLPKISDNDEGDCAPACSFMFFAGETRIVKGKLGVYQFYSVNGSKKAFTNNNAFSVYLLA